MSDSKKYPANAAGLPYGELNATGFVSCQQWVLKFEFESVTVELPWRDLKIHTTGNEEDQVFFSHPNYPGTTFYTQDARILSEHAFKKFSNLKAQLAAFQTRQIHRHLYLNATKFLAAFAGVFLVCWLVVGLISRVAISQFPLDWEQQLGEGILSDIQYREVFLEAPETTKRLTQLVEQIQRAQPKSDYEIHVQLVQNSVPNAFALPGGVIVVHTGLLEFAESPEEVAGVLAHEIAHIEHRHGIRQIMATAGPWLAIQVITGNDGGVLGALGAGSTILIGQSYSRDQEREADDTAWDYLLNAEINPQGLESFLMRSMIFESLNESQKIDIFSSHPPTQERVRSLSGKRKNLPASIHFPKALAPIPPFNSQTSN